MRTPKGKRYCSSGAELDQYRLALKLTRCPHCGAVGWLICHGYLRGYGGGSAQRVMRGRRFFCSNRDRRGGCGRTFSVLLAAFLRRFVVPARTLWDFLQGVRRGSSRKQAWEQAGLPFAVETGYRLWTRLRDRQTALRSLLCRLVAPPAIDAAEPVFQLLEHLRACFPAAACPVEAFHDRFQRSLMD